ncbi:Dephospho-CoA kinase [Thermanaeromonas toyohensis ToBE]|uniref:Dephospho-CoA kinase n=1 Tax=Thermanaeromonas toyohensis ToBE TaxID=698762 RepID=A0A1W1VU33_9FIRM|nr:Dephospho-CoA kinase [Thermanaeromonas toyohensis ToBE]
MRVLLIGKAGAGKDTVAEYLVKRHGFRRYAFADKIKQIAMELWPEEFRYRKPRWLLQQVGSKLREIDPLVWVHYVFRQIEQERPERVVITDGRLEEEYSVCRSAGFAVVEVRCPDPLRLDRLYVRDGVAPTLREAAHETEAWSCPKPDFVLDNSRTLADLYGQVDRLVGILKNRQAQAV